MRIIPVLDLMHNLVVRGIAGRREEYKPLLSPLTASADPLVVARAFRDHFGFSELYVADLDAIAGAAPDISTLTTLQAAGFTLLVDAGIRRAPDAATLLTTCVSGIVAGLETLAGPDELPDLLKRAGPSRLLFSLDLKQGRPIAKSSAWQSDEPQAIAAEVVGLGVKRLLVLDLAHVGMGSGTGTEALCSQLRASYPHVELLAGGGVRDGTDLERLRAVGVDGVLVASALHEGRIVEQAPRLLDAFRE